MLTYHETLTRTAGSMPSWIVQRVSFESEADLLTLEGEALLELTTPGAWGLAAFLSVRAGSFINDLGPRSAPTGEIWQLVGWGDMPEPLYFQEVFDGAPLLLNPPGVGSTILPFPNKVAPLQERAPGSALVRSGKWTLAWACFWRKFKSDFHLCPLCGRLLRREVGVSHCEACRKALENVAACTTCNLHDHAENMHYAIQPDGSLQAFCSQHIHGKVSCKHCGATYDWAETGEPYCPSCMATRTSCEVCGGLYLPFQGYTTRVGFFCKLCWGTPLAPYHSNKSRAEPTFRGEGPLYFGIELETTRPGSPGIPEGAASAFICRKYADLGVEASRDGSLMYGFELISQPASFEQWQLDRPRWHELLSDLIRMGYRGHNANDAGLHIHFSKAGLSFRGMKAQVALALLCDILREPLGNISRRGITALNRWARRNFSKDVVARGLSGRIVDLTELVSDGSRHAIIHGQFAPTWEFRLFRSTLREESLYAAIALTRNLALLANDLCQHPVLTAEQLQGVTFETLLRRVPNEDLQRYVARVSPDTLNELASGETEAALLAEGAELCA